MLAEIRNSKRQVEKAKKKLKCAIPDLDSVAFSLIPIPAVKLGGEKMLFTKLNLFKNISVQVTKMKN